LRAENANPTTSGIWEVGELWAEYNEKPLLFLLTEIVTDQKPFVIGGDGQNRAEPILRLNLADPPKEETLTDHQLAAIFLGNTHRRPPSPNNQLSSRLTREKP